MRAPLPAPEMRSMPLARAKACTAAILCSSRCSIACEPSGQRSDRPPADNNMSGSTIAGRSGSTSTVAEHSTISVWHLKPTQRPAKRLIAQPSKPYSMYSPTPPGDSSGTMAEARLCSLWCGSVDDTAPWSSPTSSSTPPWRSVPAALAWRITSIERSTPGLLPYHMENTPS